MNLLIVVLVLAPLLVGGFCLAWGWRGMHRRGLEAEAHPRKGAFLLILLGGLSVSAFFYPVLVAASVPHAVAVSVKVVLCGLLILWGEVTLRAALLAGQRAAAASWLIFVGIVPLVIHLPDWMSLPEALMWVSVPIILLLLAVGQYQLMKHWNKVGMQRHFSQQ